MQNHIESKEIEDLIDAVELRISQGLVALENEHIFFRLIEGVGCTDRKHFFVSILPDYINMAFELGFDKIHSINVFDLVIKKFPNIDAISITDEEGRDFLNYMNKYCAAIVFVFAAEISEYKNDPAFPDVAKAMENHNQEMSLLYGIQPIENKIIQFFKKEDPIVQTIPIIALESPKPPAFYYWPYSEDQLNQLYLSIQNRISPNENFMQSFMNKDVPQNSRTNWTGKQTELIYLFYLISGGKWELGRFEPLHDVLPKLFVCKGAELISQSLNTKYNHLLSNFIAPGKIPKHLSKIEDLVFSLNLPNKIV
jgi:hypothetical protein